jgi:hypothetical protein
VSWEDTTCPCGDRKARETMLCAACEEYLKDHPAMKCFRDTTNPQGGRRHSAIILLSCARARKRHQAQGGAR